MEVIHTPPTHDSFTPLSIHQSQTPESFFSGPPVLYHHSPSATLSLHRSDLDAAPAFSSLAAGTRPHRSSNGTSRPVNGHSHDAEDVDEEYEIPNIDIWVTSENLTLYSPTLATGLSIPYPSISLHALQPRPHPALFLQLLTQAHVFDEFDNDDGTISLNIIPRRTSAVAEGRAGSGSSSSAPPSPSLLHEREEEEEEE
ncbi:hypothetical protein N7G274_006507 [Stereocaulon virgatum]|uniref:Uncharacterized protein n=1 Tax=Stereocaulon virgatum TaxID=373712 RepID=A0ABR4A4D1_9LECA